MVGCGNIAGGFDSELTSASLPRTHAGAYAAHGGYRLTACVEPDVKKRISFMKRWNVPTGYSGLDELKAHRGAFDVISICSPTASHYADTQWVLSLKPRLIFSEKPVCIHLGEAEQLVHFCASAGVKLAVNHNRRWDPQVKKLKNELATGHWGAIRSISGHYNKGTLNNGSHMLDLLHDLVGPLILLNTGTPVYDHVATDPSVPATLTSLSGVPVSLHCGHAADYSLFELQLVTRRGVISMEDGGMLWRIRTAVESEQFQGYRALTEGTIFAGTYLNTMATAVANIHRALDLGEPLASTGDTALAAQRMCCAIREHADKHSAAR